MEIQYSRYKLTPKKRANRLSSMAPKEGVFLSANFDDQIVFADYYPHIPLGDDPVDLFLSTFQDQKTEYQQKVLKLLKEDSRYQKFPAKTFKNHQLWSGSEPLSSPVIKYKMLHPRDHVFHEALSRGIRVRLDANGQFTRESISQLLEPLSEEWKKLIDYVEDPMTDKDWSVFPLRKARDFLSGSPFDFYIYKPNCEMRPDHQELIFSAYLGSALGTWHTYCEMIEEGNLSIVQGILGFDFYEEDRPLFQGDYDKGFSPDLSEVRKIYEELALRDWKVLCSM